MARTGCAAVCTEANTYVVGGYDGGSSGDLKSAARYDPVANEWRTLPSMSNPRRYDCGGLRHVSWQRPSFGRIAQACTSCDQGVSDPAALWRVTDIG